MEHTEIAYPFDCCPMNRECSSKKTKIEIYIYNPMRPSSSAPQWLSGVKLNYGFKFHDVCLCHEPTFVLINIYIYIYIYIYIHIIYMYIYYIYIYIYIYIY